MDYGEDPINGLKREIKEETGLAVTYVSPTPIYFITAKRSNSESYVANIIYEIKFKDLNFSPSEECQELKFFNVEEARHLNLFPNVEQLLNIFDTDLHKQNIIKSFR